MALRCLERVLARLLRIAVAVLTAVHESLTSRRSGTSVRLPPITNPLLLLSGVQLARKIRRREVTSVEVVQAYIDRIQEVNPIINAVVKHRFSEALQEAAQVDKLLDDEKAEEQELEARLPFLGVPFTAKEAFALRGMPNSTGLVSRRDVVSERDACSVALLKRAGAIPLAVTNCSELCLWLESHNRLYGVTSNPYDTSRIPGGSSGGEGSILASGGSIIGIGSDVGGSIRLPAFFNGIFGHKPTSGVVSNEGQHPPCSGLQEDFLATGPMCRYAMDLLPVLRIMAGANADKLSLTSEVDLKKLRYFSVPHSGGSPMVSPVDKQLIQAQRKVAETLETDLGVRVQELHIPQFKCSTQIWGAFMASPGRDGKPARSFAELMGTEQQKVWPLWEMAKAGHSGDGSEFTPFAVHCAAEGAASEPAGKSAGNRWDPAVSLLPPRRPQEKPAPSNSFQFFLCRDLQHPGPASDTVSSGPEPGRFAFRRAGCCWKVSGSPDLGCGTAPGGGLRGLEGTRGSFRPFTGQNVISHLPSTPYKCTLTLCCVTRLQLLNPASDMCTI
ncbi:fatty-acid amide hydrolase 2-A-like isoform X2 [Brienomyrus brachyistius]|uniref:fatty-acid amide hydrolase 2-A-like isoform X2 n=1 Tax=Brienomyrus brachyistius TaxID=42636 RepID=UPI0020B40AE8|nr:fatty-acid amide hydrolase 2-A-like isoform X2 [Brienomyrus brachyistius]